jgi:NAD(P)-dependent dehydrogenase (short-subunit alcohol dehydrogenase family)
LKTVLVTGGSRGIGRATALLAAERGWDVAVNYTRDADAAQEVVVAVQTHGRRAIAVQADVADEAQVLAMFERVDRELPPLAGLVNNAGVVDAACRVEDMTVARLNRMFAINFEAVRRMSRRRGGTGGAIVNLSSVAARLGGAGQYVDYAAAKAAIDTFTLGLAVEMATDGVRVNAVRPGVIETDIHASGGQPDRAARLAPMIPMQRPGRAEEIATAIVWLLSDEASYTTGAILEVTGGR